MMEQFKAQAAELTQTSETLNNAYTSTLSAINTQDDTHATQLDQASFVGGISLPILIYA